MTSTSFNVGLGDGSRLSSRVLRPPGGGHTDIFGGEPEPPRTGRRPAQACGQTEELPKPTQTNGAEPAAQNGQAESPQAESPQAESPQPEAPAAEPRPAQGKPSPDKESPKTVTPTEPARNEPPKRVRVPPVKSSRMEGGGSGRQSRLLGRLLGKLRGEHRYSTLDKNYSFTSAGMRESIGCGSATNTMSEIEPPTQAAASTDPIDDVQFAANIDMRYSGQYLTPEQLPEFCNQLHHLVEVIRNIQSYAQVTGEYPSELEKRLEQEAREVAALAAEARNARDIAERACEQRRALREQRAELAAHLARLRDAEIRELESTVRTSDRRLFRSWEALKDSTDPAAFEPLLDEVRSKQNALDCLRRLIESRRSSIAQAPPRPLPPPNHDSEDGAEESSLNMSGRRRFERHSSNKRRRKECVKPRSVPLSEDPSRHGPQAQQVTLFITGAECSLPARASVRDILFFTAN